jgi:beta-carotene 15,15'-dioxygenase
MSCRPLAWDHALWVLVAALVSLELGTGMGFTWFHQTLVVLLFLTLGLPHGALDLLLFRRSGGRAGTLTFATVYLAASTAVLAAWWVVPAWTLVGFLLLSAWHLGESDFEHLDSLRHPLGFSRGACVVGLPFLVHPEQVSAVLANMGLTGLWSPAPWNLPMAVALSFQHFLVLVWVRRKASSGAWNHELIQSAVLAAAFWVLHPLLAFALHFTLWHAAAHSIRLRRLTGTDDWKVMLRRAAPWALPAVAALGVFVVLGDGLLQLSDAAGPALVWVSALTVPHAIVVWMSDLTEPRQVWAQRSF